MTKAGLRGCPIVLVHFLGVVLVLFTVVLFTAVPFAGPVAVLLVELGVVLFGELRVLLGVLLGVLFVVLAVVLVSVAVVLVAGPVELLLLLLLLLELGVVLILIVGFGRGIFQGDADVQPFRAQEDVTADVDSIDR